MHRLGLIGARLWWRRGSSLAVFAVAAVATMTAVVGPVYADAAAESSLRQVLSTAAPQDAGVHVQASLDVTIDPFVDIGRQLPAGFDPAYKQTVRTMLLPTLVQGPGRVPPVVSHVVWRDGACGHLVLVKGRCPRGADEVVASARTGGPTWGVNIGSIVALAGLPRDQSDAGIAVPGPTNLRVVGLYAPRNVDDPFRFGRDYFDAHPGSGPGGEGPDTIDDVFVDRPAIDEASAGTRGLVWIDYFLDPARVTRARLPALRAAVEEAQRLFPPTENLTATTQLPAVLARAHDAGSGLDGGTAVVTLQLLLLAWLVLFEVVAASAEARAPEVAVAKLRGLRSRDVAMFALSEPVVLLVAATPLGLLAGWLTTKALASRVLLDGVPVHLGAASYAAAAVALAGGLVAAALATRRILRRPILDQWRRAEEHATRTRRMLVLDGALAVGAVIALVVLRHHSGLGGRRSTLMLLGPGLAVLAAALVGLRGLPIVAAAGASMTRASRHLGTFLATRQVARRATEHRFAVLLAVATGLAAFAVTATSVVRLNETKRAEVEVGADRVINVQTASGVDLAQAVRRVDPDGRWAMAGAEWTPVGGTVGVPIEAVDTSRLQTIGYYDAALQPLLPLLSAHSARPVTVDGDELRVMVSASGSIGVPTLDATFVDAKLQTNTVTSTAVVKRGTNTVLLPVPCANGCRLFGLALDRGAGDFHTMRGTWTVSRIEVRQGVHWSTVDAQLTTPAAWRGGPHQTSGQDEIQQSAAGVTDTFVAEAGGWPSIELADLPRPLPVVLGDNATATPATPPDVNDLSGAPVPLGRVATLPKVPRLLAYGALADLQAARASLPAFDQLSRLQVWLGSAAPPDAVQRLRAAGLVVGRADTVDGHLLALRQQGPALALQLFLFASMACSLLALAATSLALAAAGRRRSFELAALLAVGLRRTSLLRACIVEQGLLLGSAVLLGVVPGVLAAAITLPGVPEFVDTPPTTLTYAPSWHALSLFVVGLAAVVLAVAAVGGSALLRSAVPSRLREAAP